MGKDLCRSQGRFVQKRFAALTPVASLRSAPAPRDSPQVAGGQHSEHNRGMEKKRIKETARQHRAFLQQTAAKDKSELTPPSAPPAPNPMQISKDERGQLEISKTGSIRVTQTFLGSSAQAGQENTALDNVRFTQVTCALPQSKGNCDEPQLLNIALDGVAALAPRDGMEVMLCSQLVALPTALRLPVTNSASKEYSEIHHRRWRTLSRNRRTLAAIERRLTLLV